MENESNSLGNEVRHSHYIHRRKKENKPSLPFKDSQIANQLLTVNDTDINTPCLTQRIESNIISQKNFTEYPNVPPLSVNDYKKVSIVKLSKTKKLFVKKEIDASNIKHIDFYLERIISYSEKLEHKNILKLSLLQKDKYSSKVCLYYKYAQIGSLDKILNNEKFRLTEELMFRIFYQLLSVIQYLHTQKVINTNLSPNKILIDKNYHIYLYDFFDCITLDEITKNFYKLEDDFFNLGTVLHLMSSKIQNQNETVSKECLYFSQKLLLETFYKSIEEIYNDDWIKKYSQKKAFFEENFEYCPKKVFNSDNEKETNNFEYNEDDDNEKNVEDLHLHTNSYKNTHASSGNDSHKGKIEDSKSKENKGVISGFISNILRCNDAEEEDPNNINSEDEDE